jgi:hypothetical protein
MTNSDLTYKSCIFYVFQKSLGLGKVGKFNEKNWDGFILSEEQLIPTAQETWAGIKVVADAIIQRAQNKTPSSTTHRISDGNSSQLKNRRFGDGTPGSCYDIRHACKRWIQENESLCKTVPIFMSQQCAYSCGACL